MDSKHTGNDAAAKVMAPIWDQFSPLQARSEHHRFLLAIAKKEAKNKRVWVFDTALGTALDAIPLIEAGFEVVGNEADPRYLKAVRQKLKKRKIRMKIVSYDWRKLDKFKPSSDSTSCCA